MLLLLELSYMIHPRISRLGIVSHNCTFTPLIATHWIPLLRPSATKKCQVTTDLAYHKFLVQLDFPLKKSYCNGDGGRNIHQLYATVYIPNSLNASTQHIDLSTLAERLSRKPVEALLLSEYGRRICHYLLEFFPSSSQVFLRARFFDRDIRKDKKNRIDLRVDRSRFNTTSGNEDLHIFQVMLLRSSQSYEYTYSFLRRLRYFEPNIFNSRPTNISSIATKLRYHVPIGDISSPSTMIKSDEASVSEIYQAFVLPIWNELVQHANSSNCQANEKLAVLEFPPLAFRAADKSLSPHHLVHVSTSLNLTWTIIRHALDRDTYEANKNAETEPNRSARPQRAYVALGSNLGDRCKFIEAACKEMTNDGIRVLRTSSLYETPPMYVEEQPSFINGVCEVETTLSPTSLLHQLQDIERRLGREKTVDKGPRNIDLDILLYEDTVVRQLDLVIPHRGMLERNFVLKPLCDLIPQKKPPRSRSPEKYKDYLRRLSSPTLYPLTPLTSSLPPINCSPQIQKTHIMAVLNLTPDSFSDGGLHSSDPSDLLSTLHSLVSDGATILDIGGQSTRPKAPQCLPSNELARILPTIQFIRSRPEFDHLVISVDTYRASVATEAVKAGANIINDVSAGTLDPEMLPTVAKLGCTIILGHMRGNSSTMSGLTDYPEGVIAGVRNELAERVRVAEQAGIFRWHIIVDPGIGFAKTQVQNLTLLRSLKKLRTACDELKHLPMCVGVSRKGFIGNITGVESPKERLLGTAVCVTAALDQGAEIIRVHDVKEMSQVVKMRNAIWEQP